MKWSKLGIWKVKSIKFKMQSHVGRHLNKSCHNQDKDAQKLPRTLAESLGKRIYSDVGTGRTVPNVLWFRDILAMLLKAVTHRVFMKLLKILLIYAHLTFPIVFVFPLEYIFLNFISFHLQNFVSFCRIISGSIYLWLMPSSDQSDC